MIGEPYLGREAMPGPGVVHIWAICLDQPKDVNQHLRGLLDSAERTRADRFFFERDRRRYTVCRGVVRLLLSRYCSRAPESIEFHYGDRGKPALRTMTGEPAEIRFNVSHAQSLGVCAVVSAAEVGVDIEWTGRTVEFESLAHRFFSPDEADEMRSEPRACQRMAFFSGWTRKEAYIKAIGDGLSCPLDAFSVTLRPGDPVRMRSIGGDPIEAARWTLQAFVPAPGYVGALAVRAPVCSMQLRTWPGVADRRVLERSPAHVELG